MSEVKVSSQLDIARRTVCAGDYAKQRIAAAAACGVGVSEIWVIECVERIYLETKTHFIMEPLRFRQ
jgi:hypothetical protein